ncbi:hypothetical protein C0Q70_03375 [Pomacea canaliculata]|uniref:Cathepsin L n=1 Tax=Pomacea canaliculata TaxID=400727 RepID=A0A2T7PSJ4_POMCA|nr:hypothetical protein C0Q70_03375 [Pomacea canaliculata]
MKCFILIAVLGLTCALDLDSEWDSFKMIYKKSYKDVDEEAYRREIWENNLDFIQRHNFEADLGIHTFRVGVNEYADMSNAEFRKVLNGFKMSETLVAGGEIFVPKPGVKLPDSVDWRTKGYVTPIKNQGQCGSCWAFSATGSLEGQWFNKTGTLVSLSEQNLVDCSKKEGNEGCEGGLMDQAFTYVLKNKGIDTEASYPYKAKKIHLSPSLIRTRSASSSLLMSAPTTQALSTSPVATRMTCKEAIATVGPISVAIDASHNSFQLYKSGVYYEKKCSATQLDHGVLAVGYGSESSKDYYIVKNSWGTTWGMQGYIQMSRNRKNNCGIATQASYPKV